MTANEITLIISSVTALTAIIAPIVSAHMSARSLERQKRIELRDPLAYEALNEFVHAYSNLNAATDAYFYIRNQDAFSSNANYRAFVVACHNLIPFIPDKNLQKELCEFMDMLLTAGKCSSRETDERFDYITIRIGAALASSSKRPFKRK